MTELREGDVGEVTSTSSRLLYAAGTPEAEAWWAENSKPHVLRGMTVPDPLPADTTDEPEPTEPCDDDASDPSVAEPTDPETVEGEPA